jgi:hypothetical protein
MNNILGQTNTETIGLDNARPEVLRNKASTAGWPSAITKRGNDNVTWFDPIPSEFLEVIQCDVRFIRVQEFASSDVL